MNSLQVLRDYLRKLEGRADHPHTIAEWAALLQKAFPSYRQPPTGERTLAKPGPDRVEVYAARRAAKQTVFHPLDDFITEGD